jgi:hypothetical protein
MKDPPGIDKYRRVTGSIMFPVRLILPLTESFSVGLVVPIPTFPVPVMLIFVLGMLSAVPELPGVAVCS